MTVAADVDGVNPAFRLSGPGSALLTVSEIDISPWLPHTAAVEALYLAFGRALRSARKEAELTQNDVARRVGLSRTSITNIERGSQHISLHQLFLLASAVGVEPATLLPDGDAALEELVPAAALQGLHADDEEKEFAVRLLQKNDRVTEARATEAAIAATRDE
jgi:transcriptional regulator with XRE-family HTH domain